MNRIRKLLGAVAASALCAGCAESTILSERDFTGEFADALTVSAPEFSVEIVQDLELHITAPSGNESTQFLNNVYISYESDPDAKDELIREFVAAAIATTEPRTKDVDKSRIVPVIKDRAWLDEIRQSLLTRDSEEPPEQVWEDYNQDLVIVYVEDSAKTMRYFSPGLLEAAQIDRKDLRSLACKNLLTILPPIDVVGSDGFYHIKADGFYDASLLLFRFVWHDPRLAVEGEMVISIPTRDLLMVTGSQRPDHLAAMKQIAEEGVEKGPYSLTAQFFVYRDGQFERFDEDAD